MDRTSGGHQSLSMQPLNGMLQSTALASQPVSSQSHAHHQQTHTRVLYEHPHRADVVMERTRDGWDYLKFCWRHAWLDLPAARLADVGTCPECAAEDDAGRGRQRYRDLHSRGFNLRQAAKES